MMFLKRSRCLNVGLGLLWAGLIGLAGPVFAAVPDKAPATARALLTAFAQIPGLEARFTETKTNALLMKPLVNRGRLYFAKSGHLARMVEHPRLTRVIVTRTTLTMFDGDQRQTMDLASRPEAQHLVSSMLDVLSGDIKRLEAAYEITYQTKAHTWTLTLVPRSKRLGTLVSRMVFQGEGLAVTTISIEEANGSSSVTKITNANPRRTFTPAEHQKIFGTDAA